MTTQRVKTHVWSRKIRVFHWLNVLTIIALIAVGLVIFNAKTLGVSVDGKILLKTIHVILGYVFAVNLSIRLLFGVIGKGVERFSQTLPFMGDFSKELQAFKADKNQTFKGHNPLGKLMVAALLLAMSVQMVTGLVVAGTDIYYPPFGQYIAEYVAEDKSDLAAIKPYSKENVNEAAYKQMREFRKPFIQTHVYCFYCLLFLIPLHVLGVIVAERREKASITSAMIHGYKYLPKEKETDN